MDVWWRSAASLCVLHAVMVALHHQHTIAALGLFKDILDNTWVANWCLLLLGGICVSRCEHVLVCLRGLQNTTRALQLAA
jgi:hypothetical protein